jgi:hypothetical protein
LDQHDGPKKYRLDREHCGLLWSNWKNRKKKSKKVLTLREACNKIIHADDVRLNLVIPDAKRNPDEEGGYIRPNVYLYGKQGSNAWRAKLSIMDFIESSATAFWRQEGKMLYTLRHRQLGLLRRIDVKSCVHSASLGAPPQ